VGENKDNQGALRILKLSPIGNGGQGHMAVFSQCPGKEKIDARVNFNPHHP